MNRILLFALCAAALAAPAQTSSPAQPTPPQVKKQPSAPAKAATGPAQQSAGADSTAVMVVHGVCSAPKATAASSTSCETTVSKQQFDSWLAMAAPGPQGASAAARQRLAQLYIELLAFSSAARKAGIESSPEFIEELRLARMRALAEVYIRKLQKQYSNPSPQELAAYYAQHQAAFEEVTLSRVFVPKSNPAAKNKEEWEKKALQVASDMRERAAKGENMDELEKQAYTALELTSTPPPTSIGARRKGSLPPDDEPVIGALKAGEASAVMTQPGGLVIYRLESRRTLPLEAVKEQIAPTLFREKMEARIKELMSGIKTDFNGEYFGARPGPSPSVPAPDAVPPPQKPAPPK